VLGRGGLRAVLLLENRLIRGAFTADRLDAVTLIAGQLAVSSTTPSCTRSSPRRAPDRRRRDQTRRRIERDLHDGAQQRLANLAIQARWPGRREAGVRRADRAVGRPRRRGGPGDGGVARARPRHPPRGARRRRPGPGAAGAGPPLGRAGRAARAGRGPATEQVELATYFAVAEALTNTTKHAAATAVTVEVDATDELLSVRVSDDGRGGAAFGGGSGLVGLKDRVEALGGRFSMQTAPDTGTTVHAEFPLSRPTGVPG
jgi:signal transduction histidine kinase